MVIKEVTEPNILASRDGKTITATQRAITSHLRPLDWATLSLVALLTFLLLIFHRGIPNWPWLFAANIAGITLIGAFTWFVDNKNQSGFLKFIRDAYPFFLYTFVFKEVSVILKAIFPFWMEPWLIKWDLFIFGTYPTVWVENFFTPWLTEIMAFSYWSYYIYIPFVGCLLYWKKRDLFHSYAFHLSVTFYVCYMFFLVLTARSPHETLAHLHHDRELIGFFDHFVDLIQRSASISGAAFPSSHVAAQWVAWLFLLKLSRFLGWVTLGLVVALTVSVVYMQYHYAVDAIGGILVLSLTLPLARLIESKFGSRKTSALSRL